MSEKPHPMRHLPWLEFRAAELAECGQFESHEVYMAARLLLSSGLPDTTAADALVAIQSSAARMTGVIPFIERIIPILLAKERAKEGRS